MAAALPDVEAFVLGTLIYVLSQQWYDLFSIYFFRLHPVFYCDNAATRPCSPEAPWTAQALFAILFLCALSLLERIGAVVLHHFPRLGSAFQLRVFMPIFGMCAGWAFGAATVQLIRALDDVCGGCVWIKMLFAVVVTLLSSSLILLLQSAFDVLLLSVAVAVASLQTSSNGHCASMLVVGTARLLRQLELLLSTLMRLLSKALSTLVMIL